MTETNDAKNPRNKPFIDFYNSKGIIPVRQDLSDINGFISRRNYLYQTLGIPLRQLKGKNVIEFGPGGGYNAIATSYYAPKSYVFVDATILSLDELRRKADLEMFKSCKIEIIESNIFDYNDARKFDLVVCEGVIPAQDEPEKMLRHVASFCDEGGILIITHMTAPSLLSEICRRVMRPSILISGSDFMEQTSIACDLFSSHFNTLKMSTRPVEDWVHDMILHDWQNSKYLFTMPDAATTLGDHFEFYSSSPKFLVDGRWYKSVAENAANMNDLLKDQFPPFNLFLLDHRVSIEKALQIDLKKAVQISELCEEACKEHDTICTDNNYENLDNFLEKLENIRIQLPETFSVTKHSIADFISNIKPFADGKKDTSFGTFKSWWGHGQQYSSFIRHTI